MTRIYQTGVHNRSGKDIDPTVIRVLGKGLKFIPTPPPTSYQTAMHSLDVAINSFIRNVKLWHHWLDSSGLELPYHHVRLRNSDFEPELDRDTTINEYIKEITTTIAYERERIVNSATTTMRKKSNLPRREVFALKQILADKEIILKPADKNLGIVILSRDWYKKEALKHLENRSNYAPLNEKATKIRITTTANKFKQLTKLNDKAISHSRKSDEDITSFVLSGLQCLEAAPFYIIPKIHKPTMQGRPIVAGHSYFLNPFAKWLAKAIQPLVEAQPRYLRDSFFLLPLLKQARLNIAPTTSKALIFITGDVENLYGNMPHGIVRNAVIDLLPFIPHLPWNINKTLKLIDILLANNIVSFNGQNYLQTAGLPMGGSASPPLANAGMNYLEEVLAKRMAHLLKYVLLWKRLIDDILIIWNGPPNLLLEFCEAYNQLHPRIRITWTDPSKKVDFLDLHIFERNSDIHHKTHQKILNKYLYVPSSSFHPAHTKIGFIKAELTRYARLSSEIEYYIETKRLFYQRLRARGYHPKLLQPIFAQHRFENIHIDPTTAETNSKSKERPFVLAIPFHPLFEESQFTPMLSTPSYHRLKIETRQKFANKSEKKELPPIVTAWKKQPNLATRLIRAKFNEPQPGDVNPNPNE